MTLDKKKLYFRCGLVIIWMIIIFMFSMQNSGQSSNTSGRLVTWVGQCLNIDLASLPLVDTMQVIVRKSAHMFSYFVLGILTYRAMLLLKPLTPYRYAALITVVYACSDEIHQLFVPGRSGQIKDVLIDSAGMMIGFACIYLFKRIRQRIKSHN